jgi:hypothetical protein
MSNRNHHHHTLVPCSLALLAACSGDLVNLGENASELAAPDSACQGAASVASSVFVQNQDELQRLAGCEVVEGDLVIYPFEGADFRALAALRVVEGDLDVGRPRFDDPEITGVTQLEGRQRDIDLQDAGWITSLAGFEALESVGGLRLRGVGADSLQPLSELHTLTQGGRFEIGPCVNLRTLEGLENVVGLNDVLVRCGSLETIAGLVLPSSLGFLSIEGASITDLGGFEVTEADALTIVRTGLRDLDGLSSLVSVQRLVLNDNPALTDADGIGGIANLGELAVSNNEVLERLPDFADVSLLEVLDVRGNPALLNLPTFPAVLAFFEREAVLEPLPPSRMNLRPDAIVVSGNASLEVVTLPRGFPAVRYVEIAENFALRRIELSDVRSLDFLLIGDNPALETLDLGRLETVDDLRVLGNPALSLEGLETVRTFSSQVSAEPTPDEPSR